MVFGPDERAQSTLVGFILLFGILTIAFSSYQAVVVPNQNAEVEFNHFQDIQNDFTEFRSTLVNSVRSNEERAVTFRLGTQYPARLLALNPPPVSGQLETIDDGNRTVEVNLANGENIATDVCETDAPTTNSLRYTPNYNEYGSPRAVSYENRFVAREFRDGNVYDEQRLIQQSSSEISLLLLNGSVSRASQESYSFNINASGRNKTAESRTVSNITIPSQYSDDEWEDTILDGMDITATDRGDGRVRIEAEGGGDLGNYTVSCAVAGVNRDPAFAPSSGENNNSSGSPRGPNEQDIRLNGIKDIDDDNVELSFNSTINTSITEARINFYQSGSPGQGNGPPNQGGGPPNQGGGPPNQGGGPNNPPESAIISEDRTGDSGTLVIGGEFTELNPEISFNTGPESIVWIKFNDGNITTRDWFVLTIQFEDVGSRQYFISLRNQIN